MFVSNLPLKPVFAYKSPASVQTDASYPVSKKHPQKTTVVAASSEQSISDQRVLQQLKNRDREVRAHELAHLSVGGQYVTSGARFTYEKGPDGRLYAVGGEVGIDTSKVAGDPVASLRKAQMVARAALAPANPSAQDRRVAAQASVLIQQARIELARQVQGNDSIDAGRQIDLFI